MTEGAEVHPKVMFKILNYMCLSFSLQIPPEPQEKPDLIGEEYLLLKVLQRKWQEPRWTGPHRVTARTDTAVRFEGKGDTWYHLSHCAKVPKTGEREQQGSILKRRELSTSQARHTTRVPRIYHIGIYDGGPYLFSI
uniref:Murine leukemia virus integrase C-terminal domain-containing protein n=1 Tax=Takifugu rubripes TaxID=31033 RepID=A0A674MC32_TAKRU